MQTLKMFLPDSATKLEAIVIQANKGSITNQNILRLMLQKYQEDKRDGKPKNELLSQVTRLLQGVNAPVWFTANSRTKQGKGIDLSVELMTSPPAGSSPDDVAKYCNIQLRYWIDYN